MAERVFQVGDVCRIRQWDDMAAEFGGGRGGDSICCKFSFPEKMRYLCGQRFTVRDRTMGAYRSEEGVEDTRPGAGVWVISADMLEYDDGVDEHDEIGSEDLSCYLFPDF